MSNVPFGRELIRMVINHGSIDPTSKVLLELAEAQLTREQACRRAPSKRTKITPEVKQQVMDLIKTTSMSEFEIAGETGLPNAGRVSEIATGKR